MDKEITIPASALDVVNEDGVLSSYEVDANKYVMEYMTNGFNSLKAYMVAKNCSYENAVGHSSQYHHSPLVKRAFQSLLTVKTKETLKTQEGLTFELSEALETAKEEGVSSLVKLIRLVAELNGHLAKHQQPTSKTTNNLNVLISKSNATEFKSILSELKEVSQQLYENNGRQTGEIHIDVKPEIPDDEA